MFYNLANADACIFEAKTALAAGATIGDNANWLRRLEVYSTLNTDGWVAGPHHP